MIKFPWFRLALIFLALLINLFSINIAIASSPVYMGVLESFKDKEAESISPRIRIVFYKDENNNWHAMKNNFNTVDELKQSTQDYPKQVTWSLIYNGKNLGSTESTQFTPLLYSDVGIQKIIKPLPPKVLLPSTAGLQFPVKNFNHRPLIALSYINKNDIGTDKWFSSPLTQKDMEHLQNTLNMKSSKIVKSYRSTNNDLLIGVTKNSTDIWWYFLSKKFKLKFLGAGLSLIEKADLSQDGNTEWVFLYNDIRNSDANRNGYVLFYDDFKKSVKFIWSYH